jgi:hypothetical protein
MSAPKHDLDDLFKAIGQVTVTWAYLETAIDLLVSEIWHRWSGNNLGLELPRTAMNRKLTFLRNWHERSKYAGLFQDFNVMLDQVEEASEHRHQLIHGIAADIEDFEDTGVATMVRAVNRTERKVTQAKLAYTIPDIVNFRNHALRLALMIGASVEIFAMGEA